MALNYKIFRNIAELYTLEGVQKKDGLRPTHDDLGLITKAAILTEGKTILWVGLEKNLKRALKEHAIKKAREIDCQNQIMLPAFTDPHTHLIFAGDRRDEFELRNQGVTYQDIAARGGGILSTVRQTRAAKGPALVAAAQARADRLIAQGVTTVEIKSGYGLSEVDEIKLLKASRLIKKIRVVSTYLGPHAIPEGRSADDYLKEIISSTLPKVRKLADRVDMFVENGSYSVPQARQYFQAAQALGFQLTAHADQLTRSGAALELSRMKATSVDHCVQISAGDIQALSLAAPHTTCVCLPTSDFYLKMNYPPARQLIDAGARVALATDYNPGTSPSLDLSLVGVLARLEMKMTAPEVIAGLTFNAARALGLEKNVGVVMSGYLADFITISAPLNSLFYDVGFHPVSMVFREGEMLQPKKS
jgi:imidazolonepropionase